MDLPLNHSIQNIFIQVGQFDRYAIFDFYYGSEAYQKYGNTVYGYIIYTPSERAKLKLEMNSNNIGNDDGLVLLDGALQDVEKNELLKTEGFMARDIRRLSMLDIGPIKNQYDNEGIKDIPNTINVEFSPDLFDGERMQLLIFRKRIEEGIPLIPSEKQKYYSLLLLLEPEKLSDDDKKAFLINPETGKFYDDVLITSLTTMVYADRKNSPFKAALNTALGNRRKERIAFICRHLGIAPKHINKLETKNKEAWMELMKLVYGFEAETLTLWGWTQHVYWDFERFIHIYLRHYKKFLINESSKGQGTGFQYALKDIRRIINIVLEANKDAIESRLRDGKGFHIQNDKGYYYNGNYYSVKIDPKGRLMQFHPQENL
ncbi:hypothetical protein [Sphingobacterium composti Ten et al. 2007 non Yoo et al. 2007]|uniref:hypothetical protein n=1 Tax=Sphingobacterium composti TaxID=363260 RepID=UPI00135A097F|nr:hypothetical protein [Sphingobacterium composti Ten et al. 2007 non Yoo et al. 2007]